MMLNVIVTILVLLWILADLLLFLRVTKTSKTQLLSGKVMSVKKTFGYRRSTLNMEVECLGNTIVSTTSSFKTNLRWWMQYVPNPGDNIFFHKIEQPSVANSGHQDVIAFGISMHEPGTLKLSWDLFAYRAETRTIIILTTIALLLFIMIKFTPYTVHIPVEFYLFLIFRVTFEIMIL